MAKIHVADLEYFEELQNALDTLLAGYLREHPQALLSTTSAFELATWNSDRIEAAKRDGRRHSAEVLRNRSMIP